MCVSQEAPQTNTATTHREGDGRRVLAQVARLLSQCGADVNMVCPDGWVREENRTSKRGVGRSLLHHAAYVGDEQVFRLLVKVTAQPFFSPSGLAASLVGWNARKHQPQNARAISPPQPYDAYVLL